MIALPVNKKIDNIFHIEIFVVSTSIRFITPNKHKRAHFLLESLPADGIIITSVSHKDVKGKEIIDKAII